MIRKIQICFLLLCFQIAYPQFNENEFEHSTVLNGLSDNNVTCIAQDNIGYMWVGTEMGLNRFDGNEFRHYFSGTKPLNIAGMYIVNIIHCYENCLGIVTRRGFQLINPKDFTYKSYRFADASPYSIYQNSLLDARQLPDKSILFCSRAGIYSFDKPDHLNFKYDAYKNSDIGKKDIVYAQNAIMLNGREVLIYIKDTSLIHYDVIEKRLKNIIPGSNKFEVFLPEKRYGSNCAKIGLDQFITFNRYTNRLTFYDALKNKKVTSTLSFVSNQELNWESKVFLINKDEFAITCSREGYYLFHIDRNTGVITSNGKKYLSSYKCNYLLVDKENRLWVGTRTGLLKQKFRTTFVKSWVLNKDKKHGLSLRLSAICRYKDKIYLGSFNRFTGLLVLDTASMQVEKHITFYGGDNEWSEIEDIQCYHKDTLWIGTGKGLLWLDVNSNHYGSVLDKNGDTVLANSQPFLYPAGKTGKAWLGDFMNGKAGYYDTLVKTFTFFSSETKPALPFTGIKHIAYDAYGDVWIGGHGLARWNNKKYCFDTMLISYAGPNKFNDDILAITADKNGSLWLYNTENILLEYKIKEKKFYEHGVHETLPQFVQSIANNVDDKLWFTTGHRLISYNLSTKKIHYFDQSDGLPIERASTRTIYFDKERRCYYSLHNNYLATFPENPPEAHTNKKHLLITEIIFADTTFYNPVNTLLRSYNQNNCSVHFTILDYESKHNYDFYYRVNNNDWINLERNKVVFFNALSAGKHFIEIKAVGKLSESFITGINIEIESPFWQRWWFILLAIICAAAIIYFIYRYRINQFRKVYVIRTKISQDLHDNIGAALSSISIFSQAAIQKNDSGNVTDSKNILQRIGETSREVMSELNDAVWLINPGNDNVQKIIQRINDYALPLCRANNIYFEIKTSASIENLDLNVEKRKAIYLILKEAVNNCLKYAAAKNLIIQFDKIYKAMHISIKDDGSGFMGDNSSSGNGLINMKQRAKDVNAKITVDSVILKGTEIILQVPLTNIGD